MPRPLRTSLFAFLAFSSLPLFAQPAAFDRSLAPQVQYGGRLPATGRITTTHSASRLIAETHLLKASTSLTMVAVDSMNYTYSDSRGGDPSSSLQFETQESSGSSKPLAYGPPQRAFQTFNPDNTVATYRTQRWNDTASAWRDLSRYSISYADGLRAGDSSWSWNMDESRWKVSSYSHYERNAAGQPVNFSRTLWNKDTRRFEPGVQISFRYDASGNLIEQVTCNDSSRNRPVSRTVYEYNSDNALTAVWTYNWNSLRIKWVGAVGYTFILSPLNERLVQENRYWDALTDTFTGYAKVRYRYLYNASRDVVTMILQEPRGNGEWQDLDRYDYTYNPQHQITSVKHASIAMGPQDWSSPVIADMRRYYYEPVPMRIRDIASRETLKVWPVPASHMLSFDARALHGKGFVGQLTAMNGRVLRVWQRATSAGEDDRVSIEDLPAGNYMLKLQTVDGKAFQSRFTVAK